MSDLIDRQAAIDALAKGNWGVEWDKALAEAILRDVPSAQPEQRWIPCGKCIHADGKHRWCKILNRSINEDYFCCWAKSYREEGGK